MHFAGEEYKQLSSTLRERLVQSISGKKARLVREKEQLDIADTSALLLHPNQFSITNPGSPGGHSSRKTTRNTRHRVDLDELGNGILSEIHKRNNNKRKAHDDDTPGSPGREGGGTGHLTPATRARTYLSHQQNAPAYSIHSLFTEKELSAHANQAHVATAHFFASSKRENQQEHHHHLNSHHASANNTDADDNASGTGAEEDAGGGTPTATDMLRTASQNFHATRSTRTHGNGFALNALAELSDKPATRPNLPYHVLANYHARPNSNAPPLPPLMNEEIDDDCARMDRLQSRPNGWVDRNLIELLVEPYLHEVDGIPQNPERFSLLHPDFPVDSGVHLYPLHGGRDGDFMLDGSGSGNGNGNGGGSGGGAGRERKRRR